MSHPGFEPGTSRLKGDYSTVELVTLTFCLGARFHGREFDEHDLYLSSVWWWLVDLNHSSRRKQIYSLPQLA